MEAAGNDAYQIYGTERSVSPGQVVTWVANGWWCKGRVEQILAGKKSVTVELTETAFASTSAERSESVSQKPEVSVFDLLTINGEPINQSVVLRMRQFMEDAPNPSPRRAA